MVILLSNEKNIYDLVTKYVKEQDVIYDNVIDLEVYISNNILNKGLDNIESIIIDINSISDTEEKTINAISRISTIFNMKIIIIALGRRIGDSILSSLFDLGIYDFITSLDEKLQDEEFRKALKGNSYIDSIKFKINNDNKNIKKRKTKVEKNPFSTFIFFIMSLISKVTETIGYILLTILVSTGTTVLINKDLRNLLIEILKGGI